jgi:hypothetical protein
MILNVRAILGDHLGAISVLPNLERIPPDTGTTDVDIEVFMLTMHDPGFHSLTPFIDSIPLIDFNSMLAGRTGL